MTRFLVIGKGRAYQSFVEQWRGKDLKDEFDGKAYYIELEDTSPIKEGFVSVSPNDFQKSQLSFMGFTRVYLFPDELNNGMEMIAFFHQAGVCPIFVITHNQSFSRLYKKLGADYVIVSNKGDNRSSWLFLQHDVG